MRPKKIYINGTATFKENGKTYGSWGSKPSINVELNEYTDLSQVWHGVSEKPRVPNGIESVHIIVLNSYGLVESKIYKGEYWLSLCADYHIRKWAYIKDLLPKGGAA